MWVLAQLNPTKLASKIRVVPYTYIHILGDISSTMWDLQQRASECLSLLLKHVSPSSQLHILQIILHNTEPVYPHTDISQYRSTFIFIHQF